MAILAGALLSLGLGLLFLLLFLCDPNVSTSRAERWWRFIPPALHRPIELIVGIPVAALGVLLWCDQIYFWSVYEEMSPDFPIAVFYTPAFIVGWKWVFRPARCNPTVPDAPSSEESETVDGGEPR
ncbi:hypothetical protein [Planctomicrobium piriforme]|uniref:Uncharacterized protein n=1 Tax=Planctomicrobium piriforme TaxID=1576369 RepID=A0A1I3BDT1_9PLAN|nr:hypothetical protein [Planctomicrobium piriforme]SFH60310.1 hypothetical protein SAMN05421753_101393 [Planctomicrobium piriforme]